ncbi:heterokaryon incompatibility protein-domain-containing protein [Copromyces sp. CBS 386.78]|nr:heterokaryon incompatibility protein-domain-containing protein [Copromyces sp. CBS 386.78]
MKHGSHHDTKFFGWNLTAADGRIAPKADDQPPTACAHHNTPGAETTSPVSMSTMLCAVCNGIFTGLLVERTDMPHHQSLSCLRRSAEKGCYICKLVAVNVQNGMSNGLYDGEPLSFEWYLSFFGFHPIPHDEIELYIIHGILSISSIPYYDEMTTELTLMDTKKITLQNTGPDVPIHSPSPAASVTDQAVLETARSWLESCCQNHALCGPVDPGFSPTRLIYIHDTSSVQLLETKNETTSHPYVAFSHCWGKSETLKLLQDDPDKGTKGNIEQLCSRIRVQRLPASYREAISVSLALGFRHIWIDSLCIIQNSHDDWAKESATMKDVYANCSLNLCASAAADTSEASFQCRDLGLVVPLDLDLEPRWTGITGRFVKLGPVPSKLHQIKCKLVNATVLKSELTIAPLNSRAWVVQEHVLSRRHLYMTGHQLWWECLDMYACEVFPKGFPIYLDSDILGRDEKERRQYYALNTQGRPSGHDGATLTSSPVGQSESTGGELARHSTSEGTSTIDMNELWNSLVNRYSGCNLTHSLDKLPALSGLAQNFSIIQGSGFALNENSYLAGLWRPYLPRALCWQTDGNNLNNHSNYRPHPYRAPSWSWASVEATVIFHPISLSAVHACPVMGVSVLPEDERYKAGRVKGGILHLRSCVIGPFIYDASLRWPWLTPSPSADSRFKKAFGDSLDLGYPQWDEFDLNSGKTTIFISYLDPLPHTIHKDGIINGTGAVRNRVRIETLTDKSRVRLFFVPIFQSPPLVSGPWRLDGLMLIQVVNKPELEGFDHGAVFQRVGSFVYFGVEKEGLDLLPPQTTIAII